MSQTTITLLFLVFAIVSFILEKIPLGLTASICALGLTLTGILDVSTTFSQYVNSNVILCVGMFVVGQALFETGMANKIGGLVTRFAKTEKTLIIAIMVIAGVMSGFLSNTGTAAVLIPVVCGIADESGYSRSHLLMPLVFAAALGGNLSIIGAPGNLMGVNALQEMGIKTSFFMYAPIGIPILLLLVIFLVTCVLTNFMSNTATTALMIPIAVSLANSLGADPRSVVIATVIAGSCAYATPIGMPANTMVVGLGGYKFKDYVKSGLPLILVSFAICMILLPILFPFYP